MSSSIMQGSRGSTMPTHVIDHTQPPSQVDPTPTRIETGQSSTGGFGQMMMRMMKLKGLIVSSF